MKITKMRLSELIAARKKDEISPQEIARAYQKQLRHLNEKYKAFIVMNKNMPVDIYKNGEGLLQGIPIGVKDNIVTRDFPTSCATKILPLNPVFSNAEVVERIEEEGGIIAGKTNLDEFGMMPPSSDNILLQTRNPWNLNHIPGGSSGGSAAAVAAGMVPVALGSDTGGSVREPASYCGVVGYKPTYGTVSRCGLVAFAPSLDQIGPITNSVKDAAIMMNVIAGYDKNDPYSVQTNISDYTENIGDDISGLTFALAKNHLNMDMSSEVKELLLQTCAIIRKHGGKVIEIELPEIELMKLTYYIIAFAEVYLNISKLEDTHLKTCYGKDVLKRILEYSRGKQLNEEIKRRILLGCLMVEQGEHYQQAIRYRTRIIQQFNKAFQKSDFILSPTSPYLPRKIVEKKDPISEYSSPEFTTWANLTGRPALTIPGALTSQELPIGIQLIGGYLAEPDLFQAGAYLENIFDFTYLIDR